MRALLPRKADAEKILNEMHQIETTNRNPAQTIMRYEPGSDSDVLSQKLNPDILMMEPTENRYCCDAAELLRAPKIGHIFFQ